MDFVIGQTGDELLHRMTNDCFLVFSICHIFNDDIIQREVKYLIDLLKPKLNSALRV